jgi:hypothetical protein
MSSQQLKNALLVGIETIVGKKLNDNEKAYVAERLSRDDQEILSTDTIEQINRKHAIFFKDIIMRFMPDDEKRQEQLENISQHL